MGREMVAWNLPGVRLARKERCLPPGWMLQMQIHVKRMFMLIFAASHAMNGQLIVKSLMA